jgi:hypothetical protein
MPAYKHPSDLFSYLRSCGVSVSAIYRNPEAAAELSRLSFLQENWLKAREEQRRYLWMIMAAPLTAPMFYLFHPSVLMLGCSIGFAIIVIVTGVAQVLRRRQTLRDYRIGMERLVQMVRKQEPPRFDDPGH